MGRYVYRTGVMTGTGVMKCERACISKRRFVMKKFFSRFVEHDEYPCELDAMIA